MSDSESETDYRSSVERNLDEVIDTVKYLAETLDSDNYKDVYNPYSKHYRIDDLRIHLTEKRDYIKEKADETKGNMAAGEDVIEKVEQLMALNKKIRDHVEGRQSYPGNIKTAMNEIGPELKRYTIFLEDAIYPQGWDKSPWTDRIVAAFNNYAPDDLKFKNDGTEFISDNYK
ncbi:hypothetical protein ASPWEDRAFT_188135 [Aspergillus wentii DTO 134E9]|uniref:Uncharacterized protein n=1 Tax=Aspergillus wentii DTO 134E9 TaxID=1073089 RepID=A0A1L9R437_ASPWE|nr:uncharacterized protein ASPWEDRAFT_188135 [Aspergillus wentii DTO 134E9]KAI9926975.1 hypothetical protein MW887_003355 [Aspergillus wentii]OJJ29689.1 hypothetical protein ASPWEDRAFT_188135 [Aspergillus wentii DTO 134E9]